MGMGMPVELKGWSITLDERGTQGRQWTAKKDGEQIHEPTCDRLCNRIRAIRYAYENRNRFRKQRHR